MRMHADDTVTVICDNHKSLRVVIRLIENFYTDYDKMQKKPINAKKTKRMRLTPNNDSLREGGRASTFGGGRSLIRGNQIL